jgi:methionyl-tRNA formyltransferase
VGLGSPEALARSRFTHSASGLVAANTLNRMRTVYLGTSAFAVTVLRRVAETEHRPLLVVTRPDRPRGRGRRLAAPPVADAARELGIDVLQPESVNSDDARAAITAVKPDAVLICAFGALIKEPLLSEHPMLNVHPSLLPRWRGAAPVERAIEAGDAVTGVSIMRPIAEMDGGPVCLQREEPIHPDDDYGSLAARLAVLGGDLLVESLDRGPEFHEQPHEGVTIAPKIGPEDRRLDPALGAEFLERRVRALNPHIGAYAETPDGERLGVRRAVVSEETLPPGSLAARGGELLLGTVDRALDLVEVVPPGGRAMDAAAYLRGRGAHLLEV